MLDELVPFLIAGAIGLIIGIEREQSHLGMDQAAGVRTFTLIGLLGALSAAIDDKLIAATVAAFVGLGIIAGYWRVSTQSGPRGVDIGLTTEMAAGAVFTLGYVTQHNAFLSVILGVSILGILLLRQPLHAFSRSQLKPAEIQAAAILATLSLVILPFIPNQPLDPWDLFNLHRFVLILIMVGGIQFSGYIVTRLAGARLGITATGIAAGLISSTAAFLAFPRLLQQNPGAYRVVIAAGLLSTATSLGELIVILSVISTEILQLVLIPLGAAISMATLAALILIFFKFPPPQDQTPANSTPLSLSNAMKLAGSLFALLIGIALVQRHLGSPSTLVVAFVAGLGDLHASALATTVLFADHQLPKEIARTAILLAVMGSLSSKLILTVVQGRGRYRVILSLFLLALLTAVSLGTFIGY